MSKADKMFKEMNDKLKLDNNENMVLHINKEGGIYFLVRDINQKETMVSISEFYRTLKNIETSLERKKKI